jgi:hypothetical protein
VTVRSPGIFEAASLELTARIVTALAAAEKVAHGA